MTSAPPLQRQRSKPRRHVWIWLLVVLLVLLGAAFVGGRAAINSYLRSDKFRAFVSRKTGDTLEAQTEVAPLSFAGRSFYTDGFKAAGTEDSWFSRMQIDEVRAAVSTRRIWEGVWQVDEVIVQKARIDLEGPRLPALPKRPKSKIKTEPKQPGIFDDLLPDRAEIGSATIRDAGLSWKGGGFAGTILNAKPQDEGWNITAHGGTVTHESLPPMEIGQMRLRYREPSLFVQEAELRQTTGGVVQVSGEVRPEESLDLLARLDGVSMLPYLAEDWRARLTGKVNGDVRVQTPLPARGAPVISGHLSIVEGQLQALPILDTIASFTRTAQFRRLNLTRAFGSFKHSGNTTEVREFTVESAGLIRIDGEFTVAGDLIDGRFQVGLTPSSLQWLPGSQERVFTVSRDGYLWAPMHLTGQISKPKEDLTPRLQAAAKSALFEDVEQTARDAADKATEAAKGALDLLLGR